MELTADPPRFATIAAHRGLADGVPENTVASTDHAIAAGADMVELDIQRTGDGAFIIHHDGHIGATAIARTPLAGLPLLEDGVTPAPKLEPFLDAARGRALLDLDLKVHTHIPELMDRVLQHAAPADLLVTSFSAAAIRAAKAHTPGLRTGLLVDEPGRFGRLRQRLDPNAPFRQARRARADVIAPHHSMLTPAFLDRAAQAGLPVVAWTVNDAAEMARLLVDPRVDTIITDHADVAARIRHSLGG